MPYEQKDNSGSLFKNDRQRDGKNDAQYQGSIMVSGVEYWLSAWVKNADNPERKTFFSLSVKPKEQRAQQPSGPDQDYSNRRDNEQAGGGDPRDEIPFAPETR